MRIVVAPQEFKGTLSAQQAAAAIAEGVRRALPAAEITLVPMADGGPGTVATVLAARGGRPLRTTVQDPLGRPVEAEWAIVDSEAAVIEMAAAAGLWRLRPEERDPRLTTTYGVGQLIAAALEAGCKRIIVGLGGSASNDGGAGMAQALGARLLDKKGADLPAGGAALARLHRIDASGLQRRLRGCGVTAATDVTNPLCGPEGASLLYGPQKGATPPVAAELDAALRRYAEVVERDLGVRVTDTPGAGAAGGLGAGLIAFLSAQVRPGVEVVAGVVGLRDRLAGADLLLTGEGRLDAQTVFGKTVVGVARLAREAGVPIIVIAGALGEGWERVLPLVDGVEPMAGGAPMGRGPPDASLGVPRSYRGAATQEEALARPRELLAATAERAVRGWGQAREIV